MAKVTMIHGETIRIVFGVRLRTRVQTGPKGGESLRYQDQATDPVRDPWYRSAGEAADARVIRAGGISPAIAEREIIRAHARYLGTKRN